MTKQQIMYLGSVALLMASGVGAAAPKPVPVTRTVNPGQSIQAAVNAAKPGDTIQIAPGTYRESVQIAKSDLTLRGSGRSTVIAAPAVKPAHTCGQAGNGICVLGTSAKPVRNVRIESLRVLGAKKNGLWASGTDRLSVRQVTVDKSGNWGIATERSLRTEVVRNTARDNAESGIFLSNTVDSEAGATDARRAVVKENLMTGNRVGLTVRRLRNLTVEGNAFTANCAGVFLVGDEGVPRAGALTVRRNWVHNNNKLCPKTARLPVIQGAGIVLTGVERVTVEDNTVWGHAGSSPFAGGIVLFKSIVGAPNSGNVIRDNVLLNNATADLANRDTGKGNRFDGNFCRVSQPAGLC
ncbi:nitrous oxide reductase family maturation protein NosD [Streptomyces sp. NPDC059176]|uniref:right-handed parallel beta-helix repeat-containing protein n=1 Tax=unclassified Streptomyces TaxID=2593676 RepID=UPI0036B3567E